MKRLYLLALAAAAVLAGCGPKTPEAKPGTAVPNMDRLMQDQMRRGGGQGTAVPGQPVPSQPVPGAR
jgi:hypothetical protein